MIEGGQDGCANAHLEWLRLDRDQGWQPQPHQEEAWHAPRVATAWSVPTDGQDVCAYFGALALALADEEACARASVCCG